MILREEQEYAILLESIRDFEPQAKAEAWLAYAADHVEETTDQESVVYLRSRGHDCHTQIGRIVERWTEEEQSRLGELGPQLTGTLGELPMSLRDFWDRGPLGEYSLTATMLRTTQWCEIAGFDRWWERLRQSSSARLFQGGGPEPVNAAYWLFNMARSDHAVKWMPQVLEDYLESISIGHGLTEPWVFERTTETCDHECHIPYASALVFAHHRLRSHNSRSRIVHGAIDTLCKQQGEDGAWRTLTGDRRDSVEATAMAVHALALALPSGWSRISELARGWLWSQQGSDGSWEEAGTPGPAHLTALVLDAIALANGGKPLTFSIGISTNEGAVSADAAKNEEPILPLDTSEQRRAALAVYQQQHLDRYNQRLTQAAFAKKAGYSSRTELERWLRCDPKRKNASADSNFKRVLRKNVDLK